MWVKATTYIELNRQLAASTATVDWMRVRINQLERRCATLEAKCGLPPTEVPEISIHRAPLMGERPAAPNTPATEDDRPSLADLLAGNLSMEDMGDDAAAKAGIDWDPKSGLVTYR
jgi:hypothetical protein